MTLLFPTDEQVERELAAIRVSLLEQTQHVRSPRRSTRYRTTRAVIIAGAAAAILTAGTIVAVEASQAERDTFVRCYEQASLDSRERILVNQPDSANPTLLLDPVDVCGLVWRTDSWAGTSDTGITDAPVPELVVCTLPDGVAGVFPRENSAASGQDFCAALGLADWDSD